MNHLLHGFVLAGALAGLGCQDLQAAPPLAVGQLGVSALASDGDSVYWTLASGDVRRVSATGGGVQQVATSVGPSLLSLDASSAIWATSTGEIARAPKAGGAPEVLVPNANAAGLQVDETSVYWFAGLDQSPTSGQIMKAPKSPGAPAVALLAMSALAPGGLTLSGASLYFLGSPTGGSVLDLSVAGGAPVTTVPGVFSLVGSALSTLCTAGPDTAAVALDPTSGAHAITCTALDGSNPHVVASGLGLVTSLTLDDTTVYFATVDGAISSAPVDGSAPMTMGAVPPDGTEGCVDGGGCTCGSATGVQVCNGSGTGTCQCSGAATFAKGPAGGATLAIDQTSVYWAHTQGDAIFVMSRF